MKSKIELKDVYEELDDRHYAYRGLMEVKEKFDVLSSLLNYEVKIVKGLHDGYARVVIVRDGFCYSVGGGVDKGFTLHIDFSFNKEFSCLPASFVDRAHGEVKRPVKMKLITEKRMLSWFGYCFVYMDALKDALKYIENQNKEIEERIKSVINSLPDARVYVCEEGVYDTVMTYLDCRLFRVDLRHNKHKGELNHNITYLGGIENVIKIETLLGNKVNKE